MSHRTEFEETIIKAFVELGSNRLNPDDFVSLEEIAEKMILRGRGK